LSADLDHKVQILDRAFAVGNILEDAQDLNGALPAEDAFSAGLGLNPGYRVFGFFNDT
jgi:hypothetical protein